MTPEGRVKEDVKAWLKRHAAYWYAPSQNGRGRVGIPDFVACLPHLNGRMVAIETKAPGKRDNVTPNQERELRDINRAGGVALVIDNVEDLDRYVGKKRQTGDEPART